MPMCITTKEVNQIKGLVWGDLAHQNAKDSKKHCSLQKTLMYSSDDLFVLTVLKAVPSVSFN